MARILFTVWPFTGHIHPNVAVARAVRADGHEVAFYTGGSVRASLEAEGFECFPLQHVNEEALTALVLSADGLMAPRMSTARFKSLWKSWVLGTVPDQLRDLAPVLDSWRPDAIVCDPTMWAPILVLSERAACPVAVFSVVPACHLPGEDGPIIGFPRPRARTAAARAWRSVLRAASSVALRDVRRDASRLRAEHGLPPLGESVTSFAGRLPLYLVPSCPEFDYRRTDLPPSVRYVGPCLLSDPPIRADRPVGARPVVYVSEGTVTVDPKLLRAAVQGLGGLPIDVIATTGKHRDPESLDLGPRPFASNVRVESWVPLLEIVSTLDAVVTVGGPSTLMAALMAGIPVVIVPFTWDHPETAWRVEESGAGIRLAPRDCTPERVAAAVQRLLADPSYRENARRLARALRRTGGPARAAELIAALARSGRPRAEVVEVRTGGRAAVMAKGQVAR
jgi:MGT family glycosyltransferase